MTTRATKAMTPIGSIGATQLLQALAAMALGLFVIGMAGFSHLDALHNATHDIRHFNAFPCH
jgi:cobalt transporter subunit CbtB